jgi:TonB-linked SusC/RagA family outer membrane protein
MKKHTFLTMLSILGMSFLINTIALAQGNQNTLRVTDEEDNPLAGTSIIAGEGARPVFTNDKGEVDILVLKKTPVLIEASGYESRLVYLSPGFTSRTEILIKSPYQATEKDLANLPFGTAKKRYIPGSVTVLNTDEIIQYDQGGGLNGILRGRVPGMIGVNNLRGNGSPLIVVDGIPRSADGLNMQQIESVTVLRDLNSTMLYGSQAQNGVVLVTTKRGKPLKNRMDVFAESGYRKAISLPKYLPAADYMTLYNEARTNDGLAPRYTTDEIDNTRSGVNPVRYPDEDYYSSAFLNDWNSYYNVVTESSGGNDVAQYYLNLGWNRSNSFLNLGEGKNERTDRLNLRSNIDYHLNDLIKLRFDGMVLFNIANGPRYSDNNFWTLSSNLLPNAFPLLIPSGLLLDSTLLAAAKFHEGSYLLGGTSEYQTNMYGELTRNGNRRSNDRIIQLSTGLDFDLNSITPGLKASLFFSFDLNNFFVTNLTDNYAVYRPVFDANDSLTTITKINQDIKQNTRDLSNSSFYRRFGTYGTVDYQKTFNKVHELNANLVLFRDQYNMESVLQPSVNLHSGIRINYSYMHKYLVQLNGVMAGSGKLYDSNRYAYSPGIGLGWILTEENFLKGNTSLNYLKLNASLARNNSDQSIGYYLYQSWYQQSGNYSYNQGSSSNAVRVVRTGNPNLDWEKTTEINLGVDAALMDYKLGIEANYFNNKNCDLITNPVNTLPSYFSGHAMINYNSNRNQGIELGLNYTATAGDLQLRLGSNFLYSVPKVLQRDEIQYEEEYILRQGKAGDAMFGYVALGLFRDSADIAGHAVQTFGQVRPGDIKYKDLNNDGKIDQLDQEVIGNSRPRYVYSFSFNLKYKNLELFALGTGQSGANRYFNSDYYWVDGDKKYSEVVLDRWTGPATTETAKYPRLTAGTSQNNFRNSTFWLENNHYFTLNTLQLTYTLNTSGSKSLDQLRLFVRGGNLLTISPIKEKLDLTIGSAPQTRVFSLGMTTTF